MGAGVVNTYIGHRSHVNGGTVTVSACIQTQGARTQVSDMQKPPNSLAVLAENLRKLAEIHMF